MSDPLADFLAREKEELDSIIGPASDMFSNMTMSEPLDIIPSEPVSEAPMTVTDPVFDAPIESKESNIITVPSTIAKPVAIIEWEKKREALLREKDEEEAQKTEELRRVAAEQLEQWYKERETLIQKTKESNRAEMAKNHADIDREQGVEADWPAIAKMCEMKAAVKGGKDLSRLKAIITGLKERSSMA